MKLFIPSIGDIIELAEDWNFDLFSEYRNDDLFMSLFNIHADEIDKLKNVIEYDTSSYSYRNKMKAVNVTLPKGTTLRIKRIYIKQGASNFNSLTFSTQNGKKKCKFWAKLIDVNQIKCKVISSDYI